MCGIAGWINWERDLTGERPTVEAMGRSLAHRGPDAEGLWLSPAAGLAHRRLVVVDPQGGGQPMVRRRGDKTYVMVYNGELYNTADLRHELEVRGHQLRSYSDTEALLLAFIEWGPACLPRLEGIFAFGVWREPERTLFLARDRLGVKPLFYRDDTHPAGGTSRRSGAFLFASEMKAILAHPGVEPAVDAEGLADVLLMGPARTPGSGVFTGLGELRPGCFLVHDQNGTRTGRYWSLQSRPHGDDLETTAAKVRDLLQGAVERQLVSDVPVCALLSGGLDSSAVTAFAAGARRKAGAGPLDTFSVDYEDNDRYFRPTAFQPDADAPWVRRVSADLGTRHRYVVVETAELVDALARGLRANDLPGMVDVDSSLYLFCREVKKGATVALSGEAADEVFGGYPWFFDAEALGAGVFPWARRAAERAALLHPDLVAVLGPLAYVRRRYEEALAEVPPLEGEAPEDRRHREMSYLNITRFMPTLLDRKDRMSMAWGLEVRVPYCDHRLVDYVWNVPWEMKSAGGQAKGLLRLALRGILPDDVRQRPKSPYPKTHSPSYLAATSRRLLDVLADPASPLVPLVDVAAVRRLVEDGAAGADSPWFGQLMGAAQWFAYLAQVDAWLRLYKVAIRI